MIALTRPAAVTAAVTVAPVPPPPVIVTTGGDVYPLPPFVTVYESTTLAVNFTVPVA